MSLELFASRTRGRLWTALRQAGRTVELRVETDGDEPRCGRIVQARVTKVLPGIQSAFVEIGRERGAFLHATELPPWDPPAAVPPIEQRLREGHVLTVQVAREERGGKGARLTCRLKLPGRALVLLPDAPGCAVSRRIRDRQERRRLSRLLEQLPTSAGGWIARTAAGGLGLEALVAEAESLVARWQIVLATTESQKGLPAVVLREPGLLEEVLRDLPAEGVERIVVDDPRDRQGVLDTLLPADPALAARVSLHTDEAPLFEVSGIDVEIDRALRRRVWLRSGGYLVIEETEALVSIDVNTGKNLGRSDLQQTVLNTNLEAADEVPRQLRLRGLGGIIVIDMIDMTTPQDRGDVVERFRHALLADPARTRVTGLSELGLLELTRKSIRRSLAQQLTVRCETCHGVGRLPRTEREGD